MEKVVPFSVMLQWKNYKYYFVKYNQLLHIIAYYLYISIFISLSMKYQLINLTVFLTMRFGF